MDRSMENISASRPSMYSAWLSSISQSTIKPYSSSFSACNTKLISKPGCHRTWLHTREGSKNLIKALNSRSKFLSIVHMSGWREWIWRAPKGEGLDGAGKPKLNDDGSMTGFSIHSRANFCSMRMLAGSCSKATMKPWSSCTLSDGSIPFRGVPCSIT